MSNSFLIIDDCEEDRYLHRRAIRGSGFEGKIAEFSDGREMLDLLSSDEKMAEFRRAAPEPYIVLLDINMPLVSGFEVAEALEAWEAQNLGRCWFVVMMLTSSSNPLDQDRAGKSTVIREYATKPLTTEMVVRITAACDAAGFLDQSES